MHEAFADFDISQRSCLELAIAGTHVARSRAPFCIEIQPDVVRDRASLNIRFVARAATAAIAVEQIGT
jgi:hypothetical protein